MKLGLMEWENFHSYRGKGSLDWSLFEIAVLIGPNGAGKSSLIDMVRWALYGTTRGDVDSCISTDEESCEVVLHFWLGEKLYRVKRVRARAGRGKTDLTFHRILPDGTEENLAQKTTPLTTKKICAVTGMTDALFTATACSSQGDAAAFAEADRADRRQILGNILQLGDWEERAKMARDDVRALEGPLAHKEADLTMLRRDAEQIPTLETDLTRITGEIETVDKEQAELEGQATAAQGQRDTLVKEREEDRAARAQYDQVGQQRTDINNALVVAQGRISALEEAVAGKTEVAAALEKAQAAGNDVERLQALEVQFTSLEAQGRQVVTERGAALQAQGARVKEAEQTIRGKKQQHEASLAALRKEQGILEKQTKVLAEVPCGDKDFQQDIRSDDLERVWEICLLLKEARNAVTRLEVIAAELDRLERDEAGHPWDADEVELTTLEAATPAAPFDTTLEGLGRQRDEIGFSAKALAEARKLAAPLDRLQKDMRAIEVAAAQLESWQTRGSELEKEVATLDDRLSNLRTALGPERKWDEELAKIDAALERIRQQRGDANRAMQRLQAERGTTEAKLERAKQAQEGVKALEEELKEIRRRIEVLQLLGNPRDGVFSKAGVPALLVEQAIPDLEATANEMLAELSNGALAVTLESQREVKGELSETLDIMVANAQGPRPYETYSGGERMRVNVAMRMALASQLAQRAGTRCETLVFDEAAAPLDAQGRELFAESLQRVGGRFANIIVITHVAELQDLFPTRILVTKDATGSHLDIGQEARNAA